MKCVLVLYITVLLFTAVKSEEEQFHKEYCKELPKSFKDKCVGVKCNKNNTKVRSVGCPVIRCVGEPIGHEEDRSQPYPGCCRKPICKNDNI